MTSMITGVRGEPNSDRNLSPSSELRTVAKTRHPDWIIRETQARPIPLEAAVMAADLLSIELIILSPVKSKLARM